MRLLVVNNLPARYRTATFEALRLEWMEQTGGDFLAVYQARRDPRRRPEWFFSSDEEIPYPHEFLTSRSLALPGLTLYRPKFGLRALLSFRPSHLVIAGWDSPAAVLALIFARVCRLPVLLWVESNASTSRRSGTLMAKVKRTLIGRIQTFLVPTSASVRYLESLLGRSVDSLVLPNPVSWPRIDGMPSSEKRLIFVGEFSSRKGFDLFLSACGKGIDDGWTAVAWGSDPEGLADRAPANVELRVGGAGLAAIVPELTAGDLWVIPSRRDPAPLTYSEALALGLRVVLSPEIAYSEQARDLPGVVVMDELEPAGLLRAAECAHAGQRPPPEVSLLVSNATWAQAVVRSFTAKSR